MPLPHRHIPAFAKINVTPLIDVVMCLIIFYLLVFRLASDRLTPVDLPSTATGTRSEQTRSLVITITGSPRRIVVDGVEVPASGLPGVLAARMPADPAARPPVQVRADRSLPYADVAPVLDACRAAGVASVRLVTERTGGP